jgi:hypothetical protein
MNDHAELVEKFIASFAAVAEPSMPTKFSI